MPELRQPLSLKEVFARIRQVLLLREDARSGDAGKERPAEGRDGALKVFLAEDASVGTTTTDRILDQNNEMLIELKRIRVLLTMLLEEKVSADDALREK